MLCKKCGALTEGINVLCYQCQLNIMNSWVVSPKNKNYILMLADEYNVRVSTIMNILAYFGVLNQ